MYESNTKVNPALKLSMKSTYTVADNVGEVLSFLDYGNMRLIKLIYMTCTLMTHMISGPSGRGAPEQVILY